MLRSVIPTRYFLGRPEIGEEMHISIEKGKTLIIRLMAVGPVVEAVHSVTSGSRSTARYVTVPRSLILVLRAHYDD